jgi:hypothetical protein
VNIVDNITGIFPTSLISYVLTAISFICVGYIYGYGPHLIDAERVAQALDHHVYYGVLDVDSRFTHISPDFTEMPDCRWGTCFPVS